VLRQQEGTISTPIIYLSAEEGLAEQIAAINAAGEKARDASLHLIDTVAAEVRKNPTRTLALTLGVGLILGLLSRSSR
jgi:ElaB/YqjD/DUF883 family membrane-anchored ribosome-binding protein